MPRLDYDRMKVQSMQIEFSRLHREKEVSENGTYEIVNASFIADKQSIFGVVNQDYVQKELLWYLSTNRNISAMIPPVPKIWQQISSTKGEVNSNYGWCIFSLENRNQYQNSIMRLLENKNSRQAIMIYTRPSIHDDFDKNGMSDFICTNTVQLMIRNGHLHYIVSMRSNDAVFGYKNDKAWHDYVFNMALKDLLKTYPELKKGVMYWNAGSLHVYPRHFHLIENMYDKRRGI